MEEIIALVHALVQDEIKNNVPPRGPRGPKGATGEFVFEEHEDKIQSVIFNKIDSIKDLLAFTYDKFTPEQIDSFRLKFSDLSDKEKESLRGERGEKGPRGQRGKSLNWENHREEIFNQLKIYFEEEKESLKLRFDNLTPEEKESLKLRFEDLTQDNIEELRGPRGLKGKQGIPGQKGEDGKDGKDGKSIYEHWLDLGNSGSEEEFVESLRGPRGYRGQKGKRGPEGLLGKSAYDIWLELGNNGSKQDFVNSLKIKGDRGMPGIAGIPGIAGRDGRDGLNGASAPKVIDIEVIQKDKKFYFIFYFDDNTEIETDYINIPDVSKIISQAVAYSIPANIGVKENGVDQGYVDTFNFVGDDVSVTVTDKVAEVSFQVDPANVVIKNVDCDATVYVGAAVRMTPGGIAVNALADSKDNSNVLGIVESKSSSTVCNIRVSGVSGENFAGLDVTKIYYLSDVTAGLIGTSIPTTSGHVKVKVGQPYSATRFMVQKGEPVVRA